MSDQGQGRKRSSVLSAPKVGEGGRGDAHRGRCFGKPLRAISRFRHQDAQPPPSPRVGEGGRGDEGQKAPNPLRPVWEKGGGGDEGRKRAGMQNIAYLS